VTGCGDNVEDVQKNDNSGIIEKKNTRILNGVIIEVNLNSIIVKPDSDDQYLKSYERIQINLTDDSKIYEIGDKVKIIYKGGINDIDPAQLEVLTIEYIN